jgi:drug/metabolite transporter (DMT)-like permease
MKLKPELKGYAYILMATVTGSTVYVFSKAALNEITLFQFGTWWFAFAIVWNLLFTLRSPETRRFNPIPGNMLKLFLLLGLVETLATGIFYTAVSLAPNPSIPSFLRNTEYIFVTLLGVILLRERFRGLEIAGMALTIIGAFVVSWHRDGTFRSFFTGSSGLMFLCTSVYAVRTILNKRFIHAISPSRMAINRALFMFVTSAVILAALRQPLRIPAGVVLSIVVGSCLGPFLTSIGQYSALKYIEASRAAIIQSTTALFTVIGVFLYFGKLPLGYQAVGGLITICGVMLLIMGRQTKNTV